MVVLVNIPPLNCPLESVLWSKNEMLTASYSKTDHVIVFRFWYLFNCFVVGDILLGSCVYVYKMYLIWLRNSICCYTQ